MPTSSNPVRLALVGCGGISAAHLDGYKQLRAGGCRDFVVTACSDPHRPSAEKRADEIKAIQGDRPQVFDAVADLVKAGVAEAADVCVPHAMHHQVGIELLNGGLHVQCEKPCGITMRAGRAMIDAAKRNKRVLGVAENNRRDLGSRAAAWAVKEAKLIGEPVSGDVIIRIDGMLPLDQAMFRWRAVKALTGGGMIFDSGAHFADMAIVLFGEPAEVDCRMRTIDKRMVKGLPGGVADQPVDVEDVWQASIRFASGVQVSYSFSNCLPGPHETHGRYRGTEGTIIDHGWPFHPFQGWGEIQRKDGVINKDALRHRYLATLDDKARDRVMPYGCENGFAVEVIDFVRAIREDRQPEMDGEAGQRAKALCFSLYESATAQKPVKYADVLSGAIDAYQRPLDQRYGLLAAAGGR